MKKCMKAVMIFTLALVVFGFSATAFCGEADAGTPREDAKESVETLVHRLEGMGIITPQQAQEYIRQYRSRTEVKGEADHASIEKEPDKDALDDLVDKVVQQIKDDVALQVKREIRSDVTTEARLGGWASGVPSWVDNLTFGGDIRLRYSGDYYDSGNAEFLQPDNPTELMNTTEDRKRFRARVRLKMNARITDQVDAGIRLATGSEQDPVSSMETFGDYMNKDGIYLDLAYVRYKPMPEMSLWAGRVPNPWYCTGLVWDSDLNFEGAVFQFDTQLMRHLRGFVSAGAFPLQEEEWSQDDKWLYGGQVGFSVRYSPVFKFTAAGAFYNYKNITGVMNDTDYPGETDWTAPEFQQVGNTLMMINYDTDDPLLALASDYDLVNLTAAFDLGIFDPVHVVISGDYVKNIGFDKDEVAERVGEDPADVSEETTGYQVGLSVGYPKVRRFGQWKCYLYQRRVGADAVLDAFTDSNFHKGGTNAKGRILGLELGLTRNVWMSTRWITSDEIQGPSFAVDTLLVDLNVQF